VTGVALAPGVIKVARPELRIAQNLLPAILLGRTDGKLRS
jgi:hypothetical protein